MIINVSLANFLRITISIVSVGYLTACNSGSSASSVPDGVAYTPFQCPGTVNVSFPGVSGIRGVEGSATDVYVTGGYVKYGSNHGFLYEGPVLGGGTCYPYNYPSSESRSVTSTSLYGPDNNGNGNVVVTGSYTTQQSGTINQLGFLYQGAVDGSTIIGWRTLDPSSLTSESINNTLGHSTMGGMVVGNYDTNVTTGNGFIYNIHTESYNNLIVPGGSASVTVYGIWYNGGTSYTLTGGYSAVSQGGTNIGFIADWNSVTRNFTRFQTLNYNNLTAAEAGTHFEGITTDGAGGYNLSADWQYTGAANTTAAFVHVPRNSDGSFAPATWTSFAYPGASWTSANTVYQNHVLGLYQIGTSSLDYGYVATIY